MDRRRLGKSEIEVGRIGFGGIPIQRLTLEEGAELVRRAVASGYDFFDTARGYTDSERKIGLGLAGRRGEVVLATKSLARTGAEMEKELAASLRDLATDWIDLYQLHYVDSERTLARVLASDGALAVLEAARAAGRVRAIGITGHDPEVLVQALETGRFATVQFPCNIVEQRSLSGLLPLARECGAGTIAMKPAAGGGLERVDLNLRWVLGLGVDAAIPGMDRPMQLAANAAAAAPWRPLSDEEIETLTAEGERLGETFCRRCGYCLPCPQGLNIPFLLLLDAYHRRYGLENWARERLATQSRSFSDCTSCGECETRCPYHLEIRELLAAGARLFAG